MSDPSTSPGASTPSSFKFDPKRWTQIDRIVGIATLIYFISLFLAWYGVSAGSGSFHIDVTADALAHGYMYIPLIVSLALLGYLVLVAGMEKMPFTLPVAHEKALMIGTAINLLFAIIAFFDKSGAGWRFGAFIGLVAAIVAFFPFGKPMVDGFRGKKSTTA